ncbi:hypothetical protein NDU88_005029 [Pleurodeles waltl]|uniref:Uncharacterized protein n=1 Tax=Pleurodeles waltl TaxID=8319 RepID=A0AAV7WAP8_PLEWA|nr:hypothetical protein NDU88_005029 [Pleurodeles waltl]
MAAGLDGKVVRAALRILGEAGRMDMLRTGVLDQTWVGMERPMRVVADSVAAADGVEAARDREPDSKRKLGPVLLGRPALNTSGPQACCGLVKCRDDCLMTQIEPKCTPEIGAFAFWSSAPHQSVTASRATNRRAREN